jgi:hypothetical protein
VLGVVCAGNAGAAGDRDANADRHVDAGPWRAYEHPGADA